MNGRAPTFSGRALLQIAVLICVVSWSAGLPAQEKKDAKGSRDHPMISRIEGSIIKRFEQKEFDEYRLVKGPVSGYGKDGKRSTNLEDELTDQNSVSLEGKVWRLTYEVPKNRSTLEIVRSYQNELTAAGFKTLFECADQECAGPRPKTSRAREAHFGALSRLLMKRAGYSVTGPISGDQRYLAARLARPEGDVYVSLLAASINVPHVRLDIIEVKPLTAGLVTVNAAAMATDIAAHGSVALYGIHFDHDRAEVKPESRPTLSEIATLLKQNAKLELFVVGHTDNNGTLEYNLDLSLRRAQAVVAALTSQFGVSSKRLDARGVGFLAPVAPNTTEENRTKNRRVELTPR